MNKFVLSVVALLSLGACATPTSSTETPFPEKPNILFILIDDLGWADLGAYGNTFNETPHIDALAREGLQFDNAYVSSPVCSPSRAGMITGRYNTRFGLTDFIPGHYRPYEEVATPVNRVQRLPPEEVTYAEVLQSAGYRTGYYGKWHLGWGPQNHPTQQGFDEALVSNGWGHFFPPVQTNPRTPVDSGTYLIDYLTEQGEGFMERHRDSAFCLVVSHFAVHLPLEAPDEDIARYRNRTDTVPGRIYNPTYSAMVSGIDESVGRLLAKLKTLDLERETLVVFASDNGGLRQIFNNPNGVLVTTNDPLRNEKGTLYEGGIRVPLIMRLPGTAAMGTRTDTPVMLIDLLPTFAALTGVSPPAEVDGVSLLPALQNQPLNRKAPLYWHYPHYHHSRPASAIQHEGYKLIEFLDTGETELYYLPDDIGEAKNLAAQQPERVAVLRALLAAWRKSVDAPLPESNPDFDVTKRGQWGKLPG